MIRTLLLVTLVALATGCSRGVDRPPAAPTAPAAMRPAPVTPTGPVSRTSGGGAAFTRLNVPFESMVGEARGRGRPAILYVCATWCGACHRMDREVLTDARVRERLRAFPTARYDPNTEDGRALADRYDIWAYPEMVLVDGSGRELERIKGAGAPERMLRVLSKY